MSAVRFIFIVVLSLWTQSCPAQTEAPRYRWAETRFPPGAESVAVPDDSEAARTAALARLRSVPATPVCADNSFGSRTFGTSCATREFPAPPILAAPTFQWNTNFGWHGAWSPFIMANRVLSGSCFNSDNQGISAVDTRTGKALWRDGKICDQGSRGGSVVNSQFLALSPETVLWIAPRDDKQPSDFFVLDVKTGKVLRSLNPVKRGPTRLVEVSLS